MSFIFMDNAAIDRKSRKLIRSHAAKGKNLGRVLPSRKKRCELGVKIAMPTREKYREENSLSIERQFGDGLSVYPMPNKLPPGSRSLVQKAFSFLSSAFYQQDLCHVVSFETARVTSMWIGYMFVDEAYFHCTIATCAAVTRTPNTRRGESIETMRHLSNTLRLVNVKLTGNEALADGTLAVIVGMTQYERLRGEYRQALVHFAGLERIIELRGGISQLLVHSSEIAQKIFKADAEIALHLGLPTRYSAKVVADYTAISSYRDSFEVDYKYKNSEPELSEKLSIDLQDVLGEIMGFSWLLNNFEGKLDGSTFNDKVILITYQLIQITPLSGQRLLSNFENVFHLSLLACITTIRLGFENQKPIFALLSKLLRISCEGYSAEDRKTQELLLWSLFMGNLSVLQEQDETWLIPKIQKTVFNLDLHCWEDARQILLKFPWVTALHNTGGKALWEKISCICDRTATSI